MSISHDVLIIEFSTNSAKALTRKLTSICKTMVVSLLKVYCMRKNFSRFNMRLAN